MKNDKALIAVLLVAIVAVAGAIVALQAGGSGSSDDSGAPVVPDDQDGSEDPVYPDGVTVDLSRGLVSYGSETTWHVYDLLESYYVKSGYTWVLYEGYDETSSSIYLSPGIYSVTVAGETFEVTIPGTLTYTSSWAYDLDGTEHSVSVTYTIDVEELSEQRARSIEFNGGDGSGSFSNLPQLVEVTDDVLALEDLLAAEFGRIGGDTSDRQAYADFLASFPQVAITYPTKISGEGEDYSLYGCDEYWARPLETLCKQYGDCEDTAALLCALYVAAGYQAAMGGFYGHVFAGVAIDGFEEVSPERLAELDQYRTYLLAAAVPVEGTCEGELAETVFYAVETIYSQLPVGYLTSGDRNFGSNTPWGIAGFYPV